MQTHHIQCDACGSSASRLEIEIIGPVGTPSEIVDLDMWIRCPKCGPRKQPPPLNKAQKGTIDYIRPMSTAHSP